MIYTPRKSVALAVLAEAVGEDTRSLHLSHGAELTIVGPLCQRFGEYVGYDQILLSFKAIMASDASHLILVLDSPGGEVAGLSECVRGMIACKTKPVYAYVDELACSAAYALACVADEIYLPEAGQVGSIGVITMLLDATAMNAANGIRIETVSSGSKKADGCPNVELTNDAIARTQDHVDKLATQFFDLVSKSRGMTVESIKALEAGVYLGQDAVNVGLADGVMSFAELLLFAQDVRNAIGKEDKKQMNTLALKKALDAAALNLKAAKTAAQKKSARTAMSAATAAFNAAITKTKMITTDTHEEEYDDGEEEAAAEDLTEEPKAELPAEEEPSEEPSDEDEDEDEDEDKDADSAKAAKAIMAVARAITGQTGVAAITGALTAMRHASDASAALVVRYQKLKAASNVLAVSAMADDALKAGKLSPAQKSWALAQSPKGLAAYLSAAPQLVNTKESAPGLEPELEVTKEMAKIWTSLGHSTEQFPALLASMKKAKK